MPIFIFESYIQGNKQSNFALISHFLHGLKTIATQVKDNELKEVMLGSGRFFIKRIEKINYLIIIKSDIEASSDEITQFSNKITNRFMSNYADKMGLPIEHKREYFERFKSDIKAMLHLGIDYDKLLEELE